MTVRDGLVAWPGWERYRRQRRRRHVGLKVHIMKVPERKQSTIRRALSLKKKPTVIDNGEEKEKLIQERRQSLVVR